ncbi:RsmB/NOP family class I SAM-dependent RNA methyltransferase [Rhodalgimonas zhirmunskyi]|nr:RsmB/NOP family class I SAM-dependent RNA methyltransferase [Rhodoalgimonas zhirmunskyi]
MAAEQALTRWARGARYAGSGDRAAVRDHVYDALRQKRSAAILGGGEDARALMLGVLRAQMADTGRDIGSLFSGETHGPDPLGPAERALVDAPLPATLPADLPEWLLPMLNTQYGADLPSMLDLLRYRAPVFLRVNLSKSTPDQARAQLLVDGVETLPCVLPGALRVTQGARRISNSRAYQDGLVELQDLSSQSAIAALPLPENGRILDYCAGGGGKTLAMAAQIRARFYAHDANPDRMSDLPERAQRAGVVVQQIKTADLPSEQRFDLVLCDVPCSGSGTWRRDPDAKWRFDAAALNRLNATQDSILDAAAPLVAQDGVLAYATCSLLREENDARIESFLGRTSGWKLVSSRQWRLGEGAEQPQNGGDGFFVAHLTRE